MGFKGGVDAFTALAILPSVCHTFSGGPAWGAERFKLKLLCLLDSTDSLDAISPYSKLGTYSETGVRN